MRVCNRGGVMGPDLHIDRDASAFLRPLSGKRATTLSLSRSRRRIRISPSAGKIPVRAVMFTWWVTSTTGRLRSAEAIHARSGRVCFCSSPGNEKKEFSAASSTTGPTARLRAVSRQRHHWLLYTVVLASPAARRRAPIRAACSLPAFDRLRCVEQSPSRKFGGSPVPGALAWRSTTM